MTGTCNCAYAQANTSNDIAGPVHYIDFFCLIYPGQNYGTDPDTGVSGPGLGPQEQFYGCADISIGQEGPSRTTTPTSPPTKTTRSTAAPPPTSRPTSPTSRPTRCWAVNEFAGDKAMDQWCETNCQVAFCPSSHCKCQYQWVFVRVLIHVGKWFVICINKTCMHSIQTLLACVYRFLRSRCFQIIWHCITMTS